MSKLKLTISTMLLFLVNASVALAQETESFQDNEPKQEATLRDAALRYLQEEIGWQAPPPYSSYKRSWEEGVVKISDAFSRFVEALERPALAPPLPDDLVVAYLSKVSGENKPDPESANRYETWRDARRSVQAAVDDVRFALNNLPCCNPFFAQDGASATECLLVPGTAGTLFVTLNGTSIGECCSLRDDPRDPPALCRWRCALDCPNGICSLRTGRCEG